jgi:hypothetical protein
LAALSQATDGFLFQIATGDRLKKHAGVAVFCSFLGDATDGDETNAVVLLSERALADTCAIFELGYFAAKLGRGRVCALLRGDLEIPSDYQGVLYVTMDENDAWHFKVAGEMRSCGLAVDTTKLIR